MSSEEATKQLNEYRANRDKELAELAKQREQAVAEKEQEKEKKRIEDQEKDAKKLKQFLEDYDDDRWFWNLALWKSYKHPTIVIVPWAIF